MEFWLDTHNPNYEVNNYGDVRNKKTNKILNPETTYRGYQRVRFTIGEDKHYYVHRLVADAFFDGEHSDLDVNHIDGNKTNNFIGNLQWTTRSDNIKHAFRTGLKKPSNRYTKWH